MRQLGQQQAGFLAVGVALVAGAGVGVAGVDHQVAGRFLGQVAARHLHRCRLEAVGGEHASGAATLGQLDDHQILFVGLFDARCDGGEFNAGHREPFGLCHG